MDSSHIHVDQFGYLPEMSKVAVISNPMSGYNASDSFSPALKYLVKKWDTDETVFRASLTPWNAGNMHLQSGDQVWWFDFTPLNTEGSFYLLDTVNNVRSVRFEIHPYVYHQVLKTTLKVFYFQRCNYAKLTTWAGSWSDPNPSFTGTEQDSDCRLATNPLPVNSRDLTGGWFDAGDYNKYMNFADGVVHQLLSAYQIAPYLWTDHFEIPESNNGIADILDEIKYELDWMLKMQNPDGSCLHKVSNLTFNSSSPPSTDAEIRRYAPATISATISACGAFAHAAIVYGSVQIPAMNTYASSLQTAAELAWTWLSANPGTSNYNNNGFVNVAAEDDAYTQQVNRVKAAIYLFALTGNSIHQQYVDSEWPNIHLFQWQFAYVFESEIQDALLYYASLPNATPSIANEIKSIYLSSLENNAANLPAISNQLDAYRAYLIDNNYVWGNNRDKSAKGSLFMNLVNYQLNPTMDSFYTAAAFGYLHYLHGVNPLNLVYLSNMQGLGGEQSASTMYHAWFHDGHPLWDQTGVSTYGPPPGYVTGGANPHYSPDGAYTGPPIEPPQNQPIQKSYFDWNTSWPENSWEVTEPGIYYQSAYIKLLASLIHGGNKCTGSSPALTVTNNLSDGSTGSLRQMMDCAMDGDTIRFSNSLNNQSISLYQGSFYVSKNLTLCADTIQNIQLKVQQPGGFAVISHSNKLTIKGLELIHESTILEPLITNWGTLEFVDFQITGPPNPTPLIENY